MKRHQFLAKVASFVLISSFVLSGCGASSYAPPSAPAAENYAAAPAMEAPAAASEPYYPDEPSDMFFEDYGVRGFVTTAKDNLSTFAVDVDTGSYTVARNYVQDGWLPPEDAVRA